MATLITRYGLALMSSDTRIQAKPALGHCLCGNIRIKCKEMSTEVHVCHCATCRGWSGAPALSIDCGRKVTFEGSEHLRTYDSSEWADRGFCAQCGTHLFYRLKHDQRYIMPVGLLVQDIPLVCTNKFSSTKNRRFTILRIQQKCLRVPRSSPR